MEGFSKYCLARSSRIAPVLSNFFLKRFSAFSMDSFSFTFTMIIAYTPPFMTAKIQYLFVNKKRTLFFAHEKTVNRFPLQVVTGVDEFISVDFHQLIEKVTPKLMGHIVSFLHLFVFSPRSYRHQVYGTISV